MQFISGLALADAEDSAGGEGGEGSGGGRDGEGQKGGGAARLLLSYGVNDCTARVASIRIDRIIAMLRFACNATSGGCPGRSAVVRRSRVTPRVPVRRAALAASESAGMVAADAAAWAAIGESVGR